MLCILWLNLAPHVAHMLALKTGKTWIELCSATGVKRIQIDNQTLDPLQAEPPSPDVAEKKSSHCLYCASQTEELYIVPTDWTWRVRQHSLSQDWIALSNLTFSSIFNWRAPPTRAPPIYLL
jgi:hypothetical protein